MVTQMSRQAQEVAEQLVLEKKLFPPVPLQGTNIWASWTGNSQAMVRMYPSMNNTRKNRANMNSTQTSGREAVDCWYQEGGRQVQCFFDGQARSSSTSGPSKQTVQAKLFHSSKKPTVSEISIFIQAISANCCGELASVSVLAMQGDLPGLNDKILPKTKRIHA